MANIAGGTFRVHLKDCDIVNCTATGVWNSYGGGAYGNTATNCLFAGNTAASSGGGAYLVRLVDCVLTNNVSGSAGGGANGGGFHTNCTFVGNTALSGGGVSGATLYGCKVLNNEAVVSGANTGRGGGLYSCNARKTDICNNTSEDAGGGAYSDVADNAYKNWLDDCVVSNNVSKGGGGGGVNRMAVTNSTVCGNTAQGSYPARGGGGFAGTFVNCTISGNTATQGGGGLGDESSVASKLLDVVDCRILGNEATESYGGAGVLGSSGTRVVSCVVSNNAVAATSASGSSGGGVSSVGVVSGCTIVDNRAPGFGGGGLYKCTAVTNCTVAGNSASSGGGASSCTLMVGCTLTNNTCTYRGNGFNGCTLYNCRVVGNKKGTGFSGGGGGWDGSCYNCLIANNEGIGFQCWDTVSELVNCTFTGNAGVGFSMANSPKLRAVNVISWGNGSTKDIATLVSSNCCLSAGSKVPEGSVNVFCEDPRLTADENGNLVPKNRKCRNAGQVFGWMTDPNDVRSKDLAGKGRIQGSAPDFGCFEATAFGMTILVR